MQHDAVDEPHRIDWRGENQCPRQIYALKMMLIEFGLLQSVDKLPMRDRTNFLFEIVLQILMGNPLENIHRWQVRCPVVDVPDATHLKIGW